MKPWGPLLGLVNWPLRKCLSCSAEICGWALLPFHDKITAYDRPLALFSTVRCLACLLRVVCARAGTGIEPRQPYRMVPKMAGTIIAQLTTPLQKGLIGSCIVFSFVNVLFVCLRIWSKRMIGRPLGWSDWLIINSCVSTHSLSAAYRSWIFVCLVSNEHRAVFLYNVLGHHIC